MNDRPTRGDDEVAFALPDGTVLDDDAAMREADRILDRVRDESAWWAA